MNNFQQAFRIFVDESYRFSLMKAAAFFALSRYTRDSSGFVDLRAADARANPAIARPFQDVTIYFIRVPLLAHTLLSRSGLGRVSRRWESNFARH